jgi:hypothetical protein
VEWTHGGGGFENSGVGDSSTGGNGRVVKGRREEGSGLLHAGWERPAGWSEGGMAVNGSL